MYCDACDRPTPAQSLPAGAVALKGARSTNPEIFRRGWKSAGPPGPELPPDLDDSSGQTTTSVAQVRGALDGPVPASQTADYGYAYEKATFDAPICGQRTEKDDGYAPGRVHGVAYGAQPRRRTDYDYDAHAATYDARPRAVHDVEGGYVPGRVSDEYACSLDVTTRNAMPRRTSDSAATQTSQAGRISDTGFDEASDYAPDSYEHASAAASVDRVQGHAAALLRFERRMMSASRRRLMLMPPDAHARVTAHPAERVKPIAGVQLIPADEPCRVTREG